MSIKNHKLLLQTAKSGARVVKGVGEIVIVECGLSKMNGNGDVLFMEETILEDAGKFVNAKIFADHAGWGGPSVRDEIGFISEAWANKDKKRIEGKVVFTDEGFKQKFANYAEHEKLELLEFSIRASAEGEQKKDPSGNGYEAFIRIARINQVFSVDHVHAGASGGKMLVFQSAGVSQQIESKEKFAMNEQQLREALDASEKKNLALTQKVSEVEAKVTALEGEKVALQQSLDSVTATGNAVLVKQALDQSTLPQASKDKIAGALDMAKVTQQDVAQAIATETAYLTAVGWKPETVPAAQTTAQSGVTGMGVPSLIQQQATQQPAPAATPEANPLFTSKKAQLMQRGMSEAAAIAQAKKFCGI